MVAHADRERFQAEPVEDALTVGWVDATAGTIDRRAILEWIVQATAPTRAKRIAEAADKASRGERANQWPRR